MSRLSLAGVAEQPAARALASSSESLRRPDAVAADDVGVHGRVFLLRRLLPLEVDLPAVAGPADLRRLVPDQAGSAHDVVHGQGEFRRRQRASRRRSVRAKGMSSFRMK